MDSYVDVIFNKTFHIENQSSSQYDEVRESQTNHEALVVPLIFSIIFICGLTGNGTLLYIVSKYRELKTVPYMLIVNLAAADFLINLICVPFTITIYTFESWHFGTVICKLNEFLQTVVVSVSILTLCALSIERYIVVNRQTSRDVITNRRYVIITLTCTWILALAFGLPDLISANVQIYEYANPPITVCIPHPTPNIANYNKVITIIKFLYLFFIPMCIIATFYCMMAVKLCRNPHEITQSYTDENTEKSLVDRVAKKGNVKKRRYHLAKLVLLLVIIFILCWLPRHVYLLWYHFSPELYTHFWHYFKIMAFCLTFLMSALNPMVIFFMDNLINRKMKRHLFCCCVSEDEELQPLEEDIEFSILSPSELPSTVNTTVNV